MFKEFKKFIQRGNVLELAVGLVMGTAFKAIVDSFVNDFIMPLISLVSGDMKFATRKIILRDGPSPEEIISINYGTFIQTILNFLIIALVIFFVVKAFNKMRERRESELAAAEAAVPEPSKEELLLTEIRNLLAERKQVNND
ncbi:MAG: large-conductance mechanosensitive channel protein MscL [Eubacteriales bacterium]|nr:large-conductance mechanosensitive channel protein MscL [Eubacteriales bacterium]